MAARESMSAVFPALSRELQRGLGDVGRDDLVAQVERLRIYEVCKCEDSFCTSFYTAPHPHGEWGSGLENVVVDVASGMVVVDVVDGEIRFIDVLDRGDLRPAFRGLRQRLQHGP
jgi:hypothetical protein